LETWVCKQSRRRWSAARGGVKHASTQSDSRYSVIDLNGDIDFRNDPHQRWIGSLIEKERIKVVINLKSVDHINYLSIGVLFGAAEAAQKFKWRSLLAGMSPFLRDIFKVVGMDRFFEDYTSLEDAIESFDDDWEGDGTSH
jgi:anti-anti-sigma factor